MSSPSSFASRVLDATTPERIWDLPQAEVMEIVAGIYCDVELASIMYGSRQFLWERLLHYVRRGYLTAQEDQGLRRILALSYRPQLVHLLEHGAVGL